MNVNSVAPYTYFMLWKKSNMKYYGCQYKKGASPIDVLTGKYRTSSKHVKLYWEQHGPPDVIVIHRMFHAPHDCRQFEHEYLKRVRATKKLDWLNKTDNIAIAAECGGSIQAAIASHRSRKKHMEESSEFRDYMARRGNDNLNSEEAMTKRKATFKEKNHSQGERNPRYGVIVKGTETANKISSKRKLQTELNKQRAAELNAIRKVCEHCGKDNLSAGNYKRWHGVNCRSLLKQTSLLPTLDALHETPCCFESL